MGLELPAIRRQLAYRISGETLADARVYRSRVLPLTASILPAVLVYSGDEAVEPYNANPASYKRVARLWTDVIGKFRPETDDLLEIIAAQVEAVVLVDPTLGGAALECELAQVLRPEPSTEGKYTFAGVRLGWDVSYATEYVEAATLEDLNLLLAEWDLAPPDGTLEATDEIDLTP